MISEGDIRKMIFGFKVKYLRQKLGLTLQQLSEKSGTSLSYINELEKGKKYPKPEKINQLAEALGTDYDSLVSSKADKKLQPILDLMTSDFVKIFPLEKFGISAVKVFELFTNTPDRVNAFISTLFNMARKYQMKADSFYKAALRSYQDMHDNYFPDLEKSVKEFRGKYKIEDKPKYKEAELKKYLLDYFKIEINTTALAEKEETNHIRSYFSKEKNTLFINGDLKESQRNFLLAREIGFQYLKPDSRPYVTRIMDANDFELLLHNFNASYFAAALLMSEKQIIKDITGFAQNPKWDKKVFLKFLTKYNVTPEMLMQRLTNILPGCFGLNDLFFLRLAGREERELFEITKEIHLSRLHNPYANENNEHYCRKWLSTNIIKELNENKKDEIIAGIQISKYWQTENEYLCLSFAKFDKNNEDGVSVTLGLLVNDKLRKTLRFLGDPDVPARMVNTTCERCAMPDCSFRAAPAITENKRLEAELIKNALEEL